MAWQGPWWADDGPGSPRVVRGGRLRPHLATGSDAAQDVAARLAAIALGPAPKGQRESPKPGLQRGVREPPGLSTRPSGYPATRAGAFSTLNPREARRPQRGRTR